MIKIVKLILLIGFCSVALSLGFVIWVYLKYYFIKMLIIENYMFHNTQSLYDTYFKHQISVFKYKRILGKLADANVICSYWVDET
jgi:hypothetical protein